MATEEIDTGKYVKRYDFWSPETWAIPKLYWDAFSQEQRIHAICRQLSKIIAYADYVGVNVNDIAQRLQDIEDGKLDEFIQTAVEEWFEENEPQIAADITLLKEEMETVLPIVSIVNEHSHDIEKLMNAEMSIAVSNSEYAVTLVQAGGKNIVFDCGSSAEPEMTVSLFQKYDVEHLDAVVITHFHGDHWSGFETIANYCDGTTDIFIQMPTPDTDHDYYAYNLGFTTVNMIIANNNLKPAVVPFEGQTHEYGDVKLTMWNTDQNNITVYENAWANSADGQTARYPSLNNYSIISKVEYLGNTYVDTGDVEGAAQQIYKNKIGKCNVAKNPHHFANRMGVFEFYKNLNPDIWLSTNNIRPKDETLVNVYSYQAGYLARYLMWMEDNTPYLGNVGQEIAIAMNHGNVDYFSGADCGIYNYTTLTSGRLDRMHFTMSLPPEYYNENPYCLTMELTLPDLSDMINDIAKAHSPKLFGIGYDATIPISANLFALFDNYPTSNAIYYTLGKPLFEAQYMYPYYHAPIAKIEPGYTQNEPTKRVIRTSPGSFVYSTAVEDNEIPSADWTFMRTANMLEVLLSTNVRIPVMKRNATIIGESEGYSFGGCVCNDDGTVIYYANISASRIITCNTVNLTTGNINAQNVERVSVIC